MHKFLQDCHQIETIAGHIYQELAAEPTYSHEVRSVFHSLCNDERSHARQIDLVLQMPERELDAITRISGGYLDAALQLAQELAATLDSRRLSEEEALKLAVQMEQRFVCVHVDNALLFHDQRLTTLFADLGRDDKGHVDRLRDCLHWWHAIRKTRPAPH